MLPLIVVGGGGHGRVVLEALRSIASEVRGVVDRDPAVATMLPKGVPGSAMTRCSRRFRRRSTPS